MLLIEGIYGLLCIPVFCFRNRDDGNEKSNLWLNLLAGGDRGELK